MITEGKEEIKTAPSWWAVLVNIVVGLFRTTPVERQEGKAVKIDNKVLKAEVDGTIDKLKRQQKIDKRIANSKKAIEVQKLRIGKMIYVDNGGATKDKEVFIGYTDEYVETNKGRYPYTQVYNWHGKAIIPNKSSVTLPA